MRHRSVTRVSLLLAAVAASACAHRAYPGARRPIDQLAVVVTAFEYTRTDVGSRIQQVVLHEVSGVACPDSECIGETSYAQLLPGSYEFEVGYDSTHGGSMVPFANLFFFGKDVADAVKNRNLKRRIRFSVEAGKTYEIYVDPETATYFLFVLNGVADEPDRPQMHPPPGAEPCVPATGAVATQCEADR